MAAVNDEADTSSYFSGSFDSIFFFFPRKLLSSISNNKFTLIIYMQQQFPVKGENDQLFPGTISPM